MSWSRCGSMASGRRPDLPAGARLLKRSALGPLAAAALALAVALAVFGLRIADPRDASWISGDAVTALFGWRQYLADPAHLFPVVSDRASWPLPMPVAVFDAIPIAALIAKALAPLLPAQFHYFGLAFLTGVFLQALFAWALLREATRGREGEGWAYQAALLIGALFFATAPILLTRFYVTQMALAIQWPLIAALWLYVRSARVGFWRSIRDFSALGFVGAAINPYTMAMVLLIYAAFVLKAILERSLRPLDLVAVLAPGLCALGRFDPVRFCRSGQRRLAWRRGLRHLLGESAHPVRADAENPGLAVHPRARHRQPGAVRGLRLFGARRAAADHRRVGPDRQASGRRRRLDEAAAHRRRAGLSLGLVERGDDRHLAFRGATAFGTAQSAGELPLVRAFHLGRRLRLAVRRHLRPDSSRRSSPCRCAAAGGGAGPDRRSRRAAGADAPALRRTARGGAVQRCRLCRVGPGARYAADRAALAMPQGRRGQGRISRFDVRAIFRAGDGRRPADQQLLRRAHPAQPGRNTTARPSPLRLGPGRRTSARPICCRRAASAASARISLRRIACDFAENFYICRGDGGASGFTPRARQALFVPGNSAL